MELRGRIHCILPLEGSDLNSPNTSITRLLQDEHVGTVSAEHGLTNTLYFPPDQISKGTIERDGLHGRVIYNVICRGLFTKVSSGIVLYDCKITDIKTNNGAVMVKKGSFDGIIDPSEIAKSQLDEMELNQRIDIMVTAAMAQDDGRSLRFSGTIYDHMKVIQSDLYKSMLLISIPFNTQTDAPLARFGVMLKASNLRPTSLGRLGYSDAICLASTRLETYIRQHDIPSKYFEDYHHSIDNMGSEGYESEIISLIELVKDFHDDTFIGGKSAIKVGMLDDTMSAKDIVTKLSSGLKAYKSTVGRDLVKNSFESSKLKNDNKINLLFGLGVDETYQENETTVAAFGKVLSALKNQKTGGSLILALTDTFTMLSVKLIFLLWFYYGNIYIAKPSVLSPFNPKKYIICSNFIGSVESDVLNVLEEINDNIVEWLNTKDDKSNSNSNFISDWLLDESKQLFPSEFLEIISKYNEHTIRNHINAFNWIRKGIENGTFDASVTK